MAARRAKEIAMRKGDEEGREQARQQVEAAKIALGERGPYGGRTAPGTSTATW